MTVLNNCDDTHESWRPRTTDVQLRIRCCPSRDAYKALLAACQPQEFRHHTSSPLVMLRTGGVVALIGGCDDLLAAGLSGDPPTLALTGDCVMAPASALDAAPQPSAGVAGVDSAASQVPKTAVKLYLAGAASQAGKSSVSMALLAALLEAGYAPEELAYVRLRWAVSATVPPPLCLSCDVNNSRVSLLRPAQIKPCTQCESEQPVARFCKEKKIEAVPVGPVVFYSGFTRAFLDGETPSAAELVKQASDAVNALCVGRRFVLVDGVGYPAVGSICGVSNAAIAAAIGAPVLYVGKRGVGDAVEYVLLRCLGCHARFVFVTPSLFAWLAAHSTSPPRTLSTMA